MAYVVLTCQSFVGVVFAMSAFSKLRSRSAFRAFASWLEALRLPLVGHAAAAAAVAEAAIVPLVALPWTAAAGLALAVAATAVFTVVTVVVMRRGTDLPCRCFGASATPLGPRHVARNAVLCLAAATGAAGASAAGAAVAGARAPGIVLSLGAGAVCAALVVFLDDLVELFAEPALASGHRGHGD